VAAFHRGELALQERAGERALAERNAVVVRGAVDPKARPFLAQQRMVLVGSADAGGHPWASVLFGPAGFVSTAEDGRSLELRLGEVPRHPLDALWSNLRPGGELGLLAIDPATRRRFRVNGWLAAVEAGQMIVCVEEAYPSCPKYIQGRRLVEVTPLGSTGEVQTGATLGARQRALVEAGDTFFVASRHPDRGPDVSHRGGTPGFVHLLEDGALRVPDYAGNGMFNTLGNLLVDDRAGLLFLDFTTARALQIAGRARIVFDQPEGGQPTGGTHRFWEVAVEQWRDFPLGVSYRWESLDPSRFNPR
jgi:predicted pyridoxine 5'-phosphate oxidase superfamily flavin-nucleotide-binding protein